MAATSYVRTVKETPDARRKRAAKILALLTKAYPRAKCSLNYSNPLELLVATILSAQCTDERVNQETVALFQKYRTAKDYAQAPLAALEHDLRRINFYRNKAKSIKTACQTLVERFGGKVPSRMEDLTTLHGVARKTANVILGNAFGVQAGIVVDTHVMRLAQRMAFTAQADRDKIEQDLMALVPQKDWTHFGHVIIQHGRATCKAPKPLCQQCVLDATLCPSHSP